MDVSAWAQDVKEYVIAEGATYAISPDGGNLSILTSNFTNRGTIEVEGVLGVPRYSDPNAHMTNDGVIHVYSGRAAPLQEAARPLLKRRWRMTRSRDRSGTAKADP